MVGILEQGKLDIATACFSVTNARSKVVDFLPTLKVGYSELFLRNPTDSINWVAYIEPLTPQCWLGILLFIVVFPPIVAGVMFYGKY